MIVAATTWPEAAIAMTGILFVTVVIAVVVWQVFGTGRAAILARSEKAYRQLAERAVVAEEKTAEQLARAAEELTGLRERTAELERMLRTVE
jgi:hypothetical protein